MQLPTAVLWDMDGTLIDQTIPIIRCYGEVIEAMGYPKPDADTIRRSMGGPMRATMQLFVREAQLEDACRLFRERFPRGMFDGLLVLPGALECIDFFHKKGVPQAILTNKHGPTARAVSAHCRFDSKIALCFGNTDTPWEKPQPELTRHVLDAMGVDAAASILIGDSPTDVASARNAGLDCIGVSTGAHSINELIEAGAILAVSDLTDLPPLFEPDLSA